jgi:hypothetical protein
MRLEGPATNHFETIFLDFPPSSSKGSDGYQNFKLPLQASPAVLPI